MSSDLPNTITQHPAYCCQRCGAPIGYLGRLIDWLTRPFWNFTLHDCKR